MYYMYTYYAYNGQVCILKCVCGKMIFCSFLYRDILTFSWFASSIR